MQFDLHITGGTLITAETTTLADIGIREGKIAAILPPNSQIQSHSTISASGCYVMPGGIDAHVHLAMRTAVGRTADSWRSGTIAAALGGTTTVVDFVDMGPNEEMVSALQSRIGEASDAVIDYGLHMTVQPDLHSVNEIPKVISAGRLAQIPAARIAGCATFKMYTAYPNFQVQDGDVCRALAMIHEVDGLACIHAEHGDAIEALREQAKLRMKNETLGIADHPTGYFSIQDPRYSIPISSAFWHNLTRPPELERLSVESIIRFAEMTRARVLVFHLGCELAVNAIGNAKARGVTNVFGETCPQYLTLTDDYLKRPDGRLWVCSPPLRPDSDQSAMWRMLRSGALDIISSDHCPFTVAQKDTGKDDFCAMPGGVPGIEVRMGIAHHFGVRTGKLSLNEWVRTCCTCPAEIHALPQKGRIAVNCDADVVIFDPTIRKSLNQAELHSTLDYSAYENITVDGWTRDVISRGDVIVQNQQFVGRVGRGKFIKR
jgi:dihydropyrimidinase